MNRARWSARLDGLSFVALAILVWGVNALQRGMWQDDVQALGEAFMRSTYAHPFKAIFAANGGPLRRLNVLPSAIAYATPQPIWALHGLCAALWLGHGLLAGWIVGLLLPGRRWTRFAVVCLTLTATSDLTACSMVALAYNFAALLLLAAAGCALLWIGRGRIVALLASAILLACSLLTIDVALPAVPFLAGLLVWIGGWRPTRRVAALLIAWTIVLIPVVVVEWSFIHDPTSYAAMALQPMSTPALVEKGLALWLENFAPWRWAFARPDWYARPAPVIPAGWMAVGSLAAAALFLLRIRGKDDGANRGDARRSAYLAALFATMALAANVAYAKVWFSELHYRTYILSRVWASAAIGILAGWAASRAPRLRWAAAAVVTGFIFLGAWGGIERQDFYLASWRLHQRELASILDAAPALRPGTAVILRRAEPSGRYLATEAGYLTKHWLRLLYGEPKLRTMRIDPQRGSGCQATADGLDCWLEGQAECFAAQTCAPTQFRFEELVLLDYDSRSGTYHVVESLRDDPLARGHQSDAGRYRPEDRIVAQPWTSRQERLLLRAATANRP